MTLSENKTKYTQLRKVTRDRKRLRQTTILDVALSTTKDRVWKSFILLISIFGKQSVAGRMDWRTSRQSTIIVLQRKSTKCRHNDSTDEISNLWYFNPISTIWLLCNFKLEYDTDGVHKGAEMWRFLFSWWSLPHPHYTIDWPPSIVPRQE